MSISNFNTEIGISLGNEQVVMFFGAGPTALTGLTSATHPLGSTFHDVVNGTVYVRSADAGDTVTDWTDMGNSSSGGDSSWREPVKVLDDTTYATITEAETAANVSDTVDGIAIGVGDRVLLVTLTLGNSNVYVVSGATGAWTFTEDTNAATVGDTVYVQDGTHNDTIFSFERSLVWSTPGGSAGNTIELNHIRTFIGKTAIGAETPTYSSSFVVTSGTSLEAAIGDLDVAFGDGTITTTASHSLTANMNWGGGTLTLTAALDALNTEIGDRTYTSAYNLTSGEVISSSLNTIDLAIGDRSAYTSTNIIVASEPLTASINKLDGAIGDRAYTQNNVVTDGEELTASIDALDQAVGSIGNVEVSANNIDASGTVPVSTFVHGSNPVELRFLAIIRETATPSKLEAYEIHVLSDGVSLSDHTTYARIRTGVRIPGIKWTVDTNGTNVTLNIIADNNIDYTVSRSHAVTFG